MALDWGSVADWVAAVGTVGALFWALWLARADRRERERREQALAHVSLLKMGNNLPLWNSCYDSLIKYASNYKKGKKSHKRIV